MSNEENIHTTEKSMEDEEELNGTKQQKEQGSSTLQEETNGCLNSVSSKDDHANYQKQEAISLNGMTAVIINGDGHPSSSEAKEDPTTMRTYEGGGPFAIELDERDQAEVVIKSAKERLRDKVFVPRNSLLTDLYQVSHFNTIYHIFIAFLVILVLHTLVYDFVESGRINLGLGPITAGFGKFHYASLIWFSMLFSTLGAYAVFGIWVRMRRTFRKAHLNRLWNIGGFTSFVLYQCIFMALVIQVLLRLDLPPASSVVVLAEMTRFIMKFHAFVRSNMRRLSDIDKILKATNQAQPNHSEAKLELSFSHYIYFLFVPVLVYRDEYPRTERIRWSVVFQHVLEIVGIIFYISFLLERFLMPLFQDIGKEQTSLVHLILNIFRSIVPASLIYMCLFYCMLHSWMNTLAELLQFADRLFYRDWWNASSFPDYIRAWNVIVYDWLYTYVYKDSAEHWFKNCRPLAMVLVFTLSAFYHEVILAFAFQFFYPVMFMQFAIIGLILMFSMKNFGKSLGNIFLWTLLLFGSGILLSLYSMEYYARRNCPISDRSLSGYLTPVSWSCNGIFGNTNWTVSDP
ncbi:sterol O-acyltransferase 1-like [Uranotaenia lowii]|uniref:sterol O-acyltransferase 1-like n=1 Tax=Uranotaenia lowii TaxID=190385 RepID=UPI00247992F4|nr:sterol O-acyltransferase 1-like [Uranotaenia lowii]